jgi:hypothetical protein
VVETVLLGEITCPCGELVLMDGGYLELWSGARSPEEQRPPEIPPGVDFEVVGPDAAQAAGSLNRQSGRVLYDIPASAAATVVAAFDDECLARGYNASLRPFERQVPHRERVRRAIAAGDSDFRISGVPVVVVGGLPGDRTFPVVATPDNEGWGWAHIRILVGDRPTASVRALGSIGVDYARFVFADADALSAWQHEQPIDGLADVVFWGRDAAQVAAELGVGPTGTPGEEGTFGWLDLPLAEANARAVSLHESVDPGAGRGYRVDFRPHSHHWQVMAGVRAADHDAATIEIDGARLMFAMTSVGDGFFPVHVELDQAGAPVAIQITVAPEGDGTGDDDLEADDE